MIILVNTFIESLLNAQVAHSVLRQYVEIAIISSYIIQMRKQNVTVIKQDNK